MFLKSLSRTRSGDAKNIEKPPLYVCTVSVMYRDYLIGIFHLSQAASRQEAGVDADCERLLSSQTATSVGQKSAFSNH